MNYSNRIGPMSRAPRVLSLFSGVGGMDLGFLQAGFTPVGAFDIWKTAIDVYKKNISSNANVSDLSVNHVEVQTEPDVVIAGSPCQGFSVVGMRRINDPRNSLFVRAAQLAIKLNPQIIVLENVLGLVAGRHKTFYDVAVNQLECAGYFVHHVKLSAQDVGLPQRRKRVFVVATQSNKTFCLDFNNPMKSIDIAISGAEHQNNHEPIVLHSHTQDYEIAKHILPGQKLCDVRGGIAAVHSWDIPSVFGDTTTKQRSILTATMRLRRRNRRRTNGDSDPVNRLHLAEYFGENISKELNALILKKYLIDVGGCIDLKRRFNGNFRRLDKSGLSNAVDTRFGQPRYFLHPEQHRGISAREAARLQGFPDTFHFSGSVSDQFKMIGNAVPVPMANTIAKAVKRMLA